VKENYGEEKWLPDSTARLLKVCSVWLATGGGVRPGWMQAYFSGDVRVCDHFVVGAPFPPLFVFSSGLRLAARIQFLVKLFDIRVYEGNTSD
jgi:hypothetical protein